MRPGGRQCAPESRQVVSRFNGLPDARIDNSGMCPRSFGMLLALASAATFAGTPAPQVGSLYARLGGAAKVTAVVDATLDQASISGDRRAFVREQWVAQICAIRGGGCAASPNVMRDAPVGVIEALRHALRAQDVPLKARNELLDLLARH